LTKIYGKKDNHNKKKYKIHVIFFYCAACNLKIPLNGQIYASKMVLKIHFYYKKFKNNWTENEKAGKR
jgi:hypothetical protein